MASSSSRLLVFGSGRYDVMIVMTVYLDANATEVLRPAALDAMVSASVLAGNPSSVHAAGRAARRVLEDSRTVLGRSFGVDADQVVFTSGGTEANVLAIHAFGQGRPIMIGATEHDAVRQAAPHAVVLPVGRDGVLDRQGLGACLAEAPGAFVCVMAANNETGVLHPLHEVSAICARYGAWLHVDAVQQAGRVPLDFATTRADSMAISGHKFGGPKGAGALLLRESRKVAPLIAGGGQERGRRGGTPALPAIAGMAAALPVALAQDWTVIARLRDAIDVAARQVGAMVAGDGLAPRLPNTTCLVLPNVPAQTQLMALDLAGFAVSAGSACSSGKVTASHVLMAMGLKKLATQAIRVSLPWNVEAAAVDRFIIAYAELAGRLGKRA